MTIIRVKKSTIFTTFLFFLLPLYSLPFIIIEMMNLKKWAFILFALFMGLIGILWPPTGDFYRYTIQSYAYKDLDWIQFWFMAILQRDLMLPIVTWITGELNFQFDITRFIYNFWGTYLLGMLFLDIISINPKLKEKPYRYFALGFFIPIMLCTFCYRYYLSQMFFIYGAYQIIFKEKKRGWLFVILSIFNHMSYFVQALVLFAQQKGFFKFKKKVIIAIVLCSFLIDGQYISKLFYLLPSTIVENYIAYIEGEWAGNFVENLSWKEKIARYITTIISNASIIIYVIIYDKLPKSKASLTNSLLFITILATPFVVIHDRFLSVAILAAKTTFLYFYNGTKKMKRCLYIMFLLVMLTNTITLLHSRKRISISDFPMMTYSSFYHIITHTYDSKWIESNVNTDGSIAE